MKYYSDKLNKLFDTEEALVEEEEKVEAEKAEKARKEKELKEARDVRWKQVQTALEDAKKAYRNYYDLNKKFWDDYSGIDPKSKTSWFNWFWDLWD